MLGVREASTQSTQVADLLRYHTSRTGAEVIRLKECVTCTQGGQHDIYYFNRESIVAASPPVAFPMTDPGDDYFVHVNAPEFEDSQSGVDDPPLR